MLQKQLKLPLFSEKISKKIPRLFLLAMQDEHLPPLEGFKIEWPYRRESDIIDISYAGIIVSTQGLLSQFKLGKIYEGKMKGPQLLNDPIFLYLRLIKVSARFFYFSFDSLSSVGRLQIEQSAKDQIINGHLFHWPPPTISSSIQILQWWHAPFDTNVVVARQNNKEIFFIEFDDLVLVFDEHKTHLKKSSSVGEETKGYLSPLLESSNQRVSLGNSLINRCLQMLQYLPEPVLGVREKMEHFIKGVKLWTEI